MGETFYCDNYEELTGKERGQDQPVDVVSVVETKDVSVDQVDTAPAEVTEAS